MNHFDKILEYYNNATVKDTNWEIIRFLLSNLSNIENMSITEIADNTFVSKATITRFVRKFGYSNFQEFKQDIYNTYHNDLNASFRTSNQQLELLKHKPEVFLETYTESICEAIKDSTQLLDLDKIDTLINSLLTRQSAIFAFNQPLTYAKEIQKDFLIKGKLISVGETFIKQKQIAERLDKQSTAVIFSNYGNYFKDYQQIIDIVIQNEVQLILVTLNYSSPLLINFDEVIVLSSKRFSDVGVYPLKLFTEYVVRRLMVM